MTRVRYAHSHLTQEKHCYTYRRDLDHPHPAIAIVVCSALEEAVPSSTCMREREGFVWLGFRFGWVSQCGVVCMDAKEHKTRQDIPASP